MYQHPVQRSKPKIVMKPEHRSEPDRLASASLPVLQLQRMAGNQAVIQLARRSNNARNRKTLYSTNSTNRIRKPDRAPNNRKPRINRYKVGQHGNRVAEQRRLSDEYGFTVSGNTHQSEHAIGFQPLNQTSGLTRRQAGVRDRSAWAYQEVLEMHREHIGTNTKFAIDGSGFNSTSYRNSQRALIEAGDVSSAVQINQLGYAFLKSTGNYLKSEEERNKKVVEIANDSYDQMVTNMDEVKYAQGNKEVKVAVDAKQRAEMYLARRAMLSGQFPTREEEDAAREKFGLPRLDEEETDMEEMEVETH